jgi:hypothetical protein
MLFKSRVHAFVQIAAVGAALAGLSADADARARRHVAVQRTAAVTGLAASHDLRREGGHLCFSDHTHYGSSLGQPNERSAQAAAVNSWSDFVDLEYGGAWSRFASASGKDMKCSQSSAGWGCELSARPCR